MLPQLNITNYQIHMNENFIIATKRSLYTIEQVIVLMILEQLRPFFGNYY